MDKAPKTYREVIDLWPNRSGLARQLRIKTERVRVWHKRDAIPEAHFHAIVAVARRCGFHGITYAALAAIKPGSALKG